MFGFEQRSHADFPLARFTKTLADIDVTIEKERDKARDLANSATELIRNYNKKYRNARMRKSSVYHEGGYVMIRDTRVKRGENAKLKLKYKGPYMAKSLGNNRYVIRDIPGFNVTAQPYNSILSSDKLKFRVKSIHSTRLCGPDLCIYSFIESVVCIYMNFIFLINCLYC